MLLKLSKMFFTSKYQLNIKDSNVGNEAAKAMWHLEKL